MAFSAADSFRAERETGALELLLVTPLRVRQVITGRLFGVWGQYALVFGLLASMWWYTGSWGALGWRRSDLPEAWVQILMLVISTYLLLPLVGMHQSLLRKHFVTSWLLTLTLGLIIPLGVPGSLFYALDFLEYQTGLSRGEPILSQLLPYAIGLQLFFAGRAAVGLFRNLDGRQFALKG
jgi:ABC-type Na+ efflux pump permease subunit